MTDHLPAPASAAAFEAGTVPIDCSGWTRAARVPWHAPLTQDLDTDVAVVGAGLAGSSLALHLVQRGVRVALLEARQPADGASGRNAGHVQPFLDKLHALERWPGRGKPFVDFFVAHRNIVFDLQARLGIDGDAQACGMVEAALRRQPSLERKARAWRQRGYAVEVVEGRSLNGLLGSPDYVHGLHWREGGRVNPYLFTQGMAAAAARLGAQVHGQTPVQACERAGRRWRLRTPQATVTADRVVICTSGHAGNPFFAQLGRTHYPLVACGLATRPLPAEVLDAVNPTRAALTQCPAGLYPMVIDRLGRMVTATIPHPGRAADAQVYFGYFLRYLHRRFPHTRGVPIELDRYWTGVTASSSHVYHEDYAKLYRVDDGVTALMNLGTWGNVMGPLLGMHLAQVMAQDRPQDLLLPLESPEPVAHPGWFAFKVRRLMMPAGRLVDRLGIA